MQLEKKNLLTPNEVTFILIGIMLDVTALDLPNKAVATAKQDGWISTLIGIIYPLYVSLLAIYVSGKFPKENILILSKKYVGKPLGTLLNLLFLLSFLSYLPALLSVVSLIIRTTILATLTPLKIYIAMLLLGAYASNKGIKVLGRICFLTFITILAIIIPTLLLLKKGSYLNISPIFGSGIINILKGSINSIYAYSLMELIFLIYPFINDSRKIASSTLKAIGFTAMIYTWISFISIYYMGKDIIPKTMWGFVTATEEVRFQIINNFRYIFIFFWLIIALKSISIFDYILMFVLDDIKKLKNREIVYMVTTVMIIIITKTYYVDLLSWEQITKYTVPISTLYNLFYITLISFLIFIKKEI